MRRIWRSERWSATTFGTPADSEVRMMMRSRFACGCISATHSWMIVVDRDRLESELELARLDLGEVEEVVDQAHQVLARDMDVAEIVAVALVADRPEALAPSSLPRSR